ncbi:MAG: DUF3488 domain-containing protein [Betaproteobacteria bacterium]|nr:DUF3488 domain-containing protein [Betaproteobacteria bacterium]
MSRISKPVLEAEALTTSRVLGLVGCLAAVLAPHAMHVPLWITLIVACAMLLRAGFAWRGYGLPATWILAALAVAAAAGTWLSYGMLFGRDAAVALLILMLCLKLMELRSTRDAYVVVFLGYFGVITNFLYSQTVPMGLYLFACVWLITAYLIGMQRQAGPRSVVALLRHSAVLLGQSIPVMAVLFILFPRIPGPLWALPQRSGSGVSGLSDTMAPGTLASLSLSDAVAFRVEFDSEPPPPSLLYWRGPVMWDFDGRTWRTGEAEVDFRRDVITSGNPIGYTVTLEPHHTRWLFGLDLPAQVPRNGIVTTDFELISLRPIRERTRYHMRSQLDYQIGRNASPATLSRGLALPDGFDPRARALARSWRETAGTPREIVQRALNMFRQQPFFYTLVPPELGMNSVDQFLFETRRGFCEHFASSFVFLMRAAGVPARVVTGYQGGVMNPVGNYMIVRQSDAHAWAEVWLPDAGWVRVDPTAAVSPQRIEAGMDAAVPAGDPLPLLARTDNEWIRQMRFAVDSFTYGWNQWVLGYTQERQLAMMARLTGRRVNTQSIVLMLAIGTVVTVSVLTYLTMRRQRRRPRDPVVALWDAFSRKLARRGLPRRPGEGPRDYVARASRELPPELREQVEAVGTLYVRIRYEADPPARAAASLREAIRAVRLDTR